MEIDSSWKEAINRFFFNFYFLFFIAFGFASKLAKRPRFEPFKHFCNASIIRLIAATDGFSLHFRFKTCNDFVCSHSIRRVQREHTSDRFLAECKFTDDAESSTNPSAATLIHLTRAHVVCVCVNANQLMQMRKLRSMISSIFSISVDWLRLRLRLRQRLRLPGWIVNVIGVRTLCRVAHRINLLEYSWPKSACHALWNRKSVEHTPCNDRSWSASHRYSNRDEREGERKINRQKSTSSVTNGARIDAEWDRENTFQSLIAPRRVPNRTQNNFYFLFQCARPINSNRVIIAENLSD